MVPPSARSSLLFIARYGERLTGADLSGGASMQGVHGGTGRVCALLLTFLSASNDRPQAMTQLQTGHEVLISSLSCDKNAATNPSTPGLSANRKQSGFHGAISPDKSASREQWVIHCKRVSHS